MTLKDQMDRAAPLVDRVNDAIRENPLAAGLIGAGFVWMLLGAKGLGAVAEIAKGTGGALALGAANVGSLAAGAGRASINAGSAAASAAKDAIVDAASIVPDASIPDPAIKSVKDTGDAIGAGIQRVASSGREYGAFVQSRLSETLERQPLLLGAIGLAIGAGIASTFATTAIESEWVGDRGAEARDKIQDVVDEAKERGRQVLSEVQNEATRQGLTLDAAKDAASSVAGKVRNVAQTARESVAQPFK